MELTACEEHSVYTKERLPGQCKGFTFFWSPDGVYCSSVQIREKAGLCFVRLSIIV